MAKSTKPSGLTIKRSNGTFTCSWSLPTHGYSQGQEFQYRTNGGNWTSASIGKTTKSKAFSANGAGTFASVGFRVRGNQKWTTGSGKKKKTHNPGMSDWAENWFNRVEYTSVLVKNCNETNGAKIDWSKTATGSTRYASTSGSAESYIDITEDSGMLNDGNSYTRWFRVRAIGPRGASGWRYARHVYATPNQNKVTDYEITASQSVSGYNVKVWFSSPLSVSRPISACKVQYALATPDAGMACPDGASWNDGATIYPKDGSSGALFSIDSLIGADQCLFVRVNAEYDDRTTYGTPKMVDVGKLKTPTITSVTADPDTHRVTVVATNNSDTWTTQTRTASTSRSSRTGRQPSPAYSARHGQARRGSACTLQRLADAMK